MYGIEQFSWNVCQNNKSHGLLNNSEELFQRIYFLESQAEVNKQIKLSASKAK